MVDCQIFNEQIENIINEYNSTVLAPYALGIDHFEQFGGNYFTDPIQDSFYDQVHLYMNEQEMYDAVLGDSKIFLVIGGGPSGLNLANALADTFPDYQVLVIDNRVVGNHLRKPFTRYRIIYSLGNIPINEYEVEKFEEARLKENIKFLFSDNVDLINLINRYNIKFVFDATGGRLDNLKNPYTNLIQVDEFEIKWDGENNCYKLKDVCLEDDENYVFIGKENVITVKQGDNYMDIWIENPLDNGSIDNISYQETIELIENLSPGNVDMETIKRDLQEKFDLEGKFQIRSFDNATQFSKRFPLYLQNNNGTQFFKFDIGDTLARVPIAIGINIGMTEMIINQNVIPTLEQIIDLINQYQECL